MKKIDIIAFTLLAAVGCQKVDSPSSDVLTFEIGLPSEVPTRTAFGTQSGSAMPLVWSAGDKVVVNGSESAALTGTPGASATFSVKGVNSTPYNILYCGRNGSDATVTFPAIQTFVAGNVAPFTLPMYATTTSLTGIILNHLGCAFKIALTSSSSVTLSRIEFVANGGEMISGDFTLGKNSGTGKFDASVFGPSGNNSKVVTMSPATSISSTAKTFYLVLPAGSYSEGFTGHFILSDESMMEVTFNTLGASTLERAKIYDFGTVAFVNQGKIATEICGTEDFTVQTISYE